MTTLPGRPGLPPEFLLKEVRFGVVLHGGISDALYMNGVVQELFRMVRATATNSPSPLIPYEQLTNYLKTLAVSYHR
jgi:hypothetical protein